MALRVKSKQAKPAEKEYSLDVGGETLTFKNERGSKALFMSQTEFVRVIGDRAFALQNGAPTTLERLPPSIDPRNPDFLKIAEEEIKQKVSPMLIVRPLPYGGTTDISVNDMILP